MAIRRTREDKVAAQIKRESISYAYSADVVGTSAKEPVISAQKKHDSGIFNYSLNLIYQDLFRSLGVTAFIALMLIIITLWLRSQGQT